MKLLEFINEGLQAEPTKCTHCDGTGKHGDKQCENCGGRGFITENHSVMERMPASIIKHKQRLSYMTDKELADRFRDYDEEKLRQMAWRHGYGKMSSHYWDRVQKGLKESAELEEGIKDWAKSLAAAGIIVGAVAGAGSINNAIDNSVPAIKAMNTALEFAQQQGNEELANMIEKDLKDAKLRLDIGRDLNHVKYLQDKYSKFLPKESIQNEDGMTSDVGDNEYVGSFDYDFTGDDGEMATGTVYYKAVNGQVDPKSLRGESEYEGNAKVDDDYATSQVQPGGSDHEHALEVAQEDYEEIVMKMRGKFEAVAEDKKPKPTDPDKWSYYKSQAKKKFDVYPSAYANAWAAKMYKKAGGGWR